jgi:very-short-patch-repair endonuclease
LGEAAATSGAAVRVLDTKFLSPKHQRVDPNPTSRSRELRRNTTEAEKRLWGRLRNGQLGFKFRRQCPIGSYFADFCSRDGHLVVELDGDQHAFAQAYDSQRTSYLNEQGYRVARFWNHEVLEDMESVVGEIALFLADPHRLAREGEAASPSLGEASEKQRN